MIRPQVSIAAHDRCGENVRQPRELEIAPKGAPKSRAAVPLLVAKIVSAGLIVGFALFFVFQGRSAQVAPADEEALALR